MHQAAHLIVALIFLAQGEPPPSDPGPEPVAPAADPAGGGMQMMIMMFAVLAFMYLLVFRPQQKREAEEKSKLEKLKKNDHVVTRGGMFGVVMNVTDKEVVLKVDENQNVKIRFQKAAIADIVSESGEAKKDDEKKG
jgi:preprotein translocase subunit YajC